MPSVDTSSSAAKKFRITRRQLLGHALGAAAMVSAPLYWYTRNQPGRAEVAVERPGMDAGHALRDGRLRQTPPAASWSCDVLIAGSGAAALTAAWELNRQGMRRFVMLEGPEPNGNNAGATDGELSYPAGAHYLALPSPESVHVRELLADLGVLLDDPYAAAPSYDEMVLVHAPEERLLNAYGEWQDTLLPGEDDDSRRFFAHIAQLSRARGADGQPLFAIPRVLSSQDPHWLALDAITFAEWLQANRYHSSSLRWYVNYCCRDDYGQGADKVSAWAGLHYFACRTGQARQAEPGAVLTWPDGLATLSRKLRERVGFIRTDALTPPTTDVPAKPRCMAGILIQAREQTDHVLATVAVPIGDRWQTVLIKTQRLICAIPLYMAARVIEDMPRYGFDVPQHLPEYAPWMVSNFIFTRYPSEQPGSALAWDNIVHNGPGLGYVVATHQLIRAARPERTAFSAYHALDDQEPSAMRQWLSGASQDELLAKAASDLRLAYPEDLWRHLQKVHIHLRGHAMCVPRPGYLANRGTQLLERNRSRILFAHSDLSGYSVFEEAAWWGRQAAQKALHRLSESVA